MTIFKRHWSKLPIALSVLSLASVAALKLSADAQTSAPSEAVPSSLVNSTTQNQIQPDEGRGQPSNTPAYTVVSCNDGDTCQLKATDNTRIKVRLVGIDAPETGKKNRKKKKDGQSGGLEAKDFLNRLVVGKSVTLRSYGTDAYGRNLAEIILNKDAVNLKMVSEGWAEVYRGKTPRGFDITAYQAAQTDALKNKKGIWSIPGYESPKDFRKRTKGE